MTVEDGRVDCRGRDCWLSRLGVTVEGTSLDCIEGDLACS